MADTVELSRIMIRFMADAMPAAASQVTQVEKTAQVERAKSIQQLSEMNRNVARGIQEWTAYAQQGLRGTAEMASLLKGKFDTVGEAANKVANVAQLIPGPWGAAISTVISAAGQLVDLLNQS